MRLTYDGSDEGLRAAADFVNTLDDDQAFWAAIEAESGFDHTDHAPAAIAALMRAHAAPVSLRDYRPIWPRHRHTNAYVDPDVPNVIFYNEKKLGRTVAEKVNTLVHEYVHVVDHAEPGAPDADFTHDGQGAQGNDRAAPNWIGDLAQRRYEARQAGA